MLNVAVIMGRLTADPELRHTQSGVAVTSFTLAVDRGYAKQGQERQTDWIDVVAWRQTAEFLCQHFQKGSAVIVTGRLEVNSWKTPDGEQRREMLVSVDAVYFGDSKPKEAQTPAHV